jgi:predicted metal-dependent HD superfamily phosphohydrolase
MFDLETPSSSSDLDIRLSRQWDKLSINLRSLFNSNFQIDRYEMWRERIFAMYSSKSRFYHTKTHIDSMLTLFSLVGTANEASLELSNQTVIILSIIFHDVIYDASKHNNELMSSELFLEFAKDVILPENIDHQIVKQVVRFILATQSHILIDSKLNGPYDSSLLLFLDLDLSILGASPLSYDEYTRNIYKEYSPFYSPRSYRSGRLNILEKFVAAPKLFKTQIMQEKFEILAKENIQRELKTLT